MQKLEAHILSEAATQAEELLQSCSLSQKLTYHSIDHTLSVVEAVREICREQQVDLHDKFIVELAAWFHDLGYVQGCEDHESKSVKYAREFMQSFDITVEDQDMVAGCIMATKMPQSPSNHLEQILCDADLIHLADENYFHKAKKLHSEIENIQDKKITQDEWMMMNSKFLTGHCFFTHYAKKKYGQKVKDNLKKINRLISK